MYSVEIAHSGNCTSVPFMLTYWPTTTSCTPNTQCQEAPVNGGSYKWSYDCTSDYAAYSQATFGTKPFVSILEYNNRTGCGASAAAATSITHVLPNTCFSEGSNTFAGTQFVVNVSTVWQYYYLQACDDTKGPIDGIGYASETCAPPKRASWLNATVIDPALYNQSFAQALLPGQVLSSSAFSTTAIVPASAAVSLEAARWILFPVTVLAIAVFSF